MFEREATMSTEHDTLCEESHIPIAGRMRSCSAGSLPVGLQSILVFSTRASYSLRKASASSSPTTFSKQNAIVSQLAFPSSVVVTRVTFGLPSRALKVKVREIALVAMYGRAHLYATVTNIHGMDAPSGCCAWTS